MAVRVDWSVVVVRVQGPVLFKGREKPRGEGCPARILTTFEIRPTWGRRLSNHHIRRDNITIDEDDLLGVHSATFWPVIGESEFICRHLEGLPLVVA